MKTILTISSSTALWIALITRVATAEEWKVYRDPTFHYSVRYPANMRIEPVRDAPDSKVQRRRVRLVFLGARPLTFDSLEIYPVSADWMPDFGGAKSDCGWSHVAGELRKSEAHIYCGEDGAAGSIYQTVNYVIPMHGMRLVVELVRRHLNDPEMQLDQKGEPTALDETLSAEEQQREKTKYEDAVTQSDSLLDDTFEQIVSGLKVSDGRGTEKGAAAGER